MRTGAALTLCVCCGACGDTLPFPRVGKLRVRVPWRSAATATPQPQGSTRTHRRRVPHAPTHHLPPFHRLFRETRPAKDPKAPLLSAVYVCPSPWLPPGNRNCKEQEKLGDYPPGLKLQAANAGNYTPHISPPGGHPSNCKMPQQAKIQHWRGKPPRQPRRETRSQRQSGVRRTRTPFSNTFRDARNFRWTTYTRSPPWTATRPREASSPQKRNQAPRTTEETELGNAAKASRTRERTTQDRTAPATTQGRQEELEEETAKGRAEVQLRTRPAIAVVKTYVDIAQTEHSGPRHSFGARGLHSSFYACLNGPGTSALRHPAFRWRLGHFVSFSVSHQSGCSE